MQRLLAFLVVLATATAAHAGCTTPVAVADSADNYGATLVVDVLANDRDADGDALEVQVTATTCSGDAISVRGSLVQVEPAGHVPRSCSIDYRVTDITGRSATARLSLAAVSLPALFADGFERGSTAAWSLVCTSSCLPEPESW